MWHNSKAVLVVCPIQSLLTTLRYQQKRPAANCDGPCVLTGSVRNGVPPSQSDLYAGLNLGVGQSLVLLARQTAIAGFEETAENLVEISLNSDTD